VYIKRTDATEGGKKAMFDKELQKAAARYATAKTVETYVGLVILVGGIAFVVAMGIQAVQSIRHVFGI